MHIKFRELSSRLFDTSPRRGTKDLSVLDKIHGQNQQGGAGYRQHQGPRHSVCLSAHLSSPGLLSLSPTALPCFFLLVHQPIWMPKQLLSPGAAET